MEQYAYDDLTALTWTNWRAIICRILEQHIHALQMQFTYLLIYVNVAAKTLNVLHEHLYKHQFSTFQ